MAIGVQRARQELRDLVELVLLPGMAALLPWRLTFSVYRRLAGLPWLYREPSDRALAEAQQRGWAPQPDEWLRRRKLTTLIDHADHYLARTRTDRWMARHLETTGAWPTPGAAGIALTFHWGAGMWGLRHAAAAGLKGHMLVASTEGEHFAGRAVMHRYIKARTRSIALSMQSPYIEVSGGMRPVIETLRASEQVFAVVDVPADQVVASQPVDILGMKARVPTALLRLAVDKGVPVCLYVTGIRMSDGQRTLNIRNLGTVASMDELTTTVFAELDQLIRADPPAWHFWSEAPRFFRV